MAQLPIIPDTYRVAITWHDATHNLSAVNVIHIRAVGSSAAAVAAACDSHMTHDMLDAVSSYGNIIAYTVTPLDGSSATITRTATGITGGAQTTADYTPAASAVVSFYTDLRGRSHRGRLYLPFTAETVVSEGNLVGATVANLLSGWNAFRAAITPMTLVVASYKHATEAQVTSVAVQQGIGTQRRRQTRVRYPGS